MGLIKPDKGIFSVNNMDLDDINLIYQWRDQIAHVPQNIFLKEGTIEDNICFDEDPKKMNRLMLANAAKIAEIFNFIKNSKLGLKQLLVKGYKIKWWQRQRITELGPFIEERNS